MILSFTISKKKLGNIPYDLVLVDLVPQAVNILHFKVGQSKIKILYSIDVVSIGLKKVKTYS